MYRQACVVVWGDSHTNCTKRKQESRRKLLRRNKAARRRLQIQFAKMTKQYTFWASTSIAPRTQSQQHGPICHQAELSLNDWKAHDVLLHGGSEITPPPPLSSSLEDKTQDKSGRQRNTTHEQQPKAAI